MWILGTRHTEYWALDYWILKNDSFLVQKTQFDEDDCSEQSPIRVATGFGCATKKRAMCDRVLAVPVDSRAFWETPGLSRIVERNHSIRFTVFLFSFNSLFSFVPSPASGWESSSLPLLTFKAQLVKSVFLQFITYKWSRILKGFCPQFQELKNSDLSLCTSKGRKLLLSFLGSIIYSLSGFLFFFKTENDWKSKRKSPSHRNIGNPIYLDHLKK